MRSFTERTVAAAKLDASLFEEVEHDKGAIGQAVALVVLASIAMGIGSVVYAGVSGLFVGALIALIGWVIWAALTWFIGTRVLPESATEADIGELLRTIGFAAAPGMLRVLGVIPGIGGLLVLICNIWMLAAMVIGVRQALDYSSTWRALGVCVIGWIVLVILQGLMLSAVGT